METILDKSTPEQRLQMQTPALLKTSSKRDVARGKGASRAYFPRDQFVQKLAGHFRDRRELENQRLYLVTVTYKEPSGRALTPRSLATMFDKTYHQILKLTVHRKRYQKKNYRPLHPVVYAFLDEPGSKHKTHNNAPRMATGDGLHHHCIVAVSERIAEKFDALCRSDPTENARSLKAEKNLSALKKTDAEKYAREIERIADLEKNDPKKLPATFLKTFHVEAIGESNADLEKVIDYASYHARKRSKLEPDNWTLFYPESLSERHVRSVATITHHDSHQ